MLEKSYFPSRGKVTFLFAFPQNKLLSLTFPKLNVPFPVFYHKINSIFNNFNISVPLILGRMLSKDNKMC